MEDPFAQQPGDDPFAETQGEDPFAEEGAPTDEQPPAKAPDPTPEPPASPPPSDPDDERPVPTEEQPQEPVPAAETEAAGPVEPSPPEQQQQPAEQPQEPPQPPAATNGTGAAQGEGKTPTRPYVVLARVAENQEVEVPGGDKIKGTLWIEVDDRVQARNNGHAQRLAYQALGNPPKVRVSTIPDAQAKGGGQGWNPKTIEPEQVPERMRLKIS